MAQYPTFTVTDLSDYSGRPVASYTNTAYVTQALFQAKVLFKWATGLTDTTTAYPDDASEAELARMGILAMADVIYLAQPFQRVTVAPFQSEGIGSYHYSKATSSTKGKNYQHLILDGTPTGVSLFDLAVRVLCVSDIIARVQSDSLQVFTDELSGMRMDDGSFKIYGPKDVDHVDVPAYDYRIPVSYDPNTPQSGSLTEPV